MKGAFGWGDTDRFLIGQILSQVRGGLGVAAQVYTPRHMFFVASPHPGNDPPTPTPTPVTTASLIASPLALSSPISSFNILPTL